MGEALHRMAVIGPVYPYKGGISHYTGLLVRALRADGLEVDAVTYRMQYPKLLFRREQRDYRNKSFAVKDARALIHTANPFSWLRSAKEINARAPELVLFQWWHPYFAPCYRALARSLQRDAKRQGRRLKIAFLCHNVLPHERFPLDRVLTRGTLKHADFCIVQSAPDAEDLRKLLPGMRHAVRPHPTYHAFRMRGISREEARAMLGMENAERMLLFFGYVRKYKGLPYLIEALGELKEDARLKLYIVGDFGDQKEEYMARIAQAGVEECIVIRDGYVPDAEVEPYFAAADLCICPYLSATQSGIVQIAYGFGLPVIATAVGGLPEAVTDKKTGYIVAPADAAALAAAIRQYFTGDTAARFRSNVEGEAARFSWERMTEAIRELYGADGD